MWLYNDYSIPPSIQTLKEIRQEFSQQVFLNALEEGEIVGSVRAYLEKGTAYIGRLMVKPDSQNKGIGTRFMLAIEEHFRTATGVLGIYTCIENLATVSSSVYL